MSTYEITRTNQLDDLTAEDLVPFLDDCGRLDVRIGGDAVARPFAVLNLLRAAGFLHAHTWVETSSTGSGEEHVVSLRVTAMLPPAPDGVAVLDLASVRRERALTPC